MIYHDLMLFNVACFDFKNFYLDAALEDPEYMCTKLTTIPQEFIDKYKLTKLDQVRWIYFAIIRSCYGLKQSKKQSSDFLRKRIEAETITEQQPHLAFGDTRGTQSSLFLP